MRAELLILLLVVIISSCDEGRLYEDNLYNGDVEGRVIVMSGTLRGTQTWPGKYDLVVAGFTSTSEYYVISKDVNAKGDGEIYIELSGVPDEVTSARLCVVNKISRLVATFVEEDFGIDMDTLKIEVDEMDVSMMSAIQTNIFNTTCVQCHGGSNFAGGGLYLTEGDAYENLVDVAAQTIEDTLRVKSGDADGSLLYNLLTLSSANNSFEETHFGMIYSGSTKLTLVEDWINSLER